jgi:hypothetical protein
MTKPGNYTVKSCIEHLTKIAQSRSPAQEFKWLVDNYDWMIGPLLRAGAQSGEDDEAEPGDEYPAGSGPYGF